MRTYELNLTVLDVDMSDAVFIHIYVTQIPNHALLVVWRPVVPAKGVEYSSSCNEALREIPKNVEVEAVLAWDQTLDLPIDGGWGLFLRLVENKRPGNPVAGQHRTTASHLLIRGCG